MKEFPRVQVIPLPDDKASFQVDGKEVTRYHYGKNLIRPYLFPWIGPAGRPITRISHPHDPMGHSHHYSIWVAHHDVNGVDFWGDRSGARIVHERIESYEDGLEEATMVVHNLWRSPEGEDLLKEVRGMTLRPLDNGESFIDVSLKFSPLKESLTFGKTPFGFFSVRVAKTMSIHDGGGTIRNSEGGVDEEEVFWKRAKWVDYSGPITPWEWNGIAFFDHPENPRHPTYFHVRGDGWMGASFCCGEPFALEPEDSLSLRFRLFAHAGKQSMEALSKRWEEFREA